MTRTIKEEVHNVLDGYFGESLENSENEEVLRQHLYDPLVEVAYEAFKRGQQHSDARLHRQMKLAQRRAAAANKNAARLFADSVEWRNKILALNTKFIAIAPHIRAMFGI
jgi:hypothetical protein